MTMQFIINNEQFQNQASEFLDLFFANVLDNVSGQIELRPIKDNIPYPSFHNTYDSTISEAINRCNAGFDVYFGVNPRAGGAGKKENIHQLVTFHAEIDYGTIGHKKPSHYETYEEALNAIKVYKLPPTAVNHSGGGFHCYWILSNPIRVSDHGVEYLESINKGLMRELKADGGTQDISRILRIPGTYNFKQKDNPREVTIVSMEGPKYVLSQFDYLLAVDNKKEKNIDTSSQTPSKKVWDQTIDKLPVSDRIKNLIQYGNDGTYSSRSEVDMAVVAALFNKGMGDSEIKMIFQEYSIGDKYRNHPSGENYLKHTIDKAKEMSDLSEEERQDPLFIAGAIRKSNNRYSLETVPFQEYMARLYKIKFFEKENSIYKYNSKCYEHCSQPMLNNLCQQELQKYRKLFPKAKLKELIHFTMGEDLVDAEIAHIDQITYLTFQNGLFNLNEMKLIPHTDSIFTTNLLPYDYDPDAECPRFIQFLQEVFENDQGKIAFIQEAIGYCFHKAIPKPAVFFLIGPGSNGKSVFIDTLNCLVGEENTCSVSLNSLSNEYYLLDLFGKMLNISSETPQKKMVNTDIFKAVVAGDWVSGRKPYQEPLKFKPFVKHYLAMNQLPDIQDSSHGMWRRIYIIEFQRVFAEHEMDVYLTEKLKNELPGIFNFALQGYKRLQTKEFIFTEGSLMKQSKQNYKNQSNSVSAFTSQFLAKGEPNERVVLKNLYDSYQAFCVSEGLKDIHTKSEFRKVLQTIGFNSENSKKDANMVCVFGAKYLSLTD